MTEKSVEKYVCPYCSKSVNEKSILCLHCDKDISVGIIAPKVEDPEKRHNLIKDLLDFNRKKIFNNYSLLNSKIKESESVIVIGISINNAQHISDIFSKYGLLVQIKPTAMIKASSTNIQTVGTVKENRSSKKIFDFLILIFMITAGVFIYRHYSKPSLETQDQALQQVDHRKNGLSPHVIRSIEESNNPSLKDSINNLVSATVLIKGPKSTGSGFIIREDGYILTNNHVIKDQPYLNVFLENGRKFDASVVEIRSQIDLALLKVDAEKLPVLAMGDARMLKRGDDVWTIGAPKQLAFSVTKGIMSFVGRKINNIYYLQSDVAINPGNSGGPMINTKGEVIGINSFMMTQSQGLNFALPINYAYNGADSILGSIDAAKDDSGEFKDSGSAPTNLKAYFQNKAPDKEDDNIDQEYQRKYLQRIEMLRADYDRVNSRLETEKKILQDKKAYLESKYNSSSYELNISEEVEIAKKLREAKINYLRKDIEVYQHRLEFYRKTKNVLKESMIFVKNISGREQLNKSLMEIEEDTERIHRVIPEINDEIQKEIEKNY